ncbi:hypothetical protein [Variovorax sp. W2I14]|uniref:hypothetical protein n=1 Tax=Variovorax sp. W2I14 TaxID=3042290 RepID=UPI003D1CE036
MSLRAVGHWIHLALPCVKLDSSSRLLFDAAAPGNPNAWSPHSNLKRIVAEQGIHLNLDFINPTVLGWLVGLCVLGLIRYWLNRRK